MARPLTSLLPTGGRCTAAAIALAAACGTAAGCSSGGAADVADSAGRVQQCAGLARDVSSGGSSGSPSADQAQDTLRRLEERVAQLPEGELKTSATALRDRLAEVAAAAQAADRTRLQTALRSARDAAARVAKACGLPVDRFVR